MKYKRIEQGNRIGRLACMETVNASGYWGAAPRRDKRQADFPGGVDAKELAAEARQEAKKKIHEQLGQLMKDAVERREERYAGQRSV